MTNPDPAKFDETEKAEEVATQRDVELAVERLTAKVPPPNTPPITADEVREAIDEEAEELSEHDKEILDAQEIAYETGMATGRREGFNEGQADGFRDAVLAIAAFLRKANMTETAKVLEGAVDEETPDHVDQRKFHAALRADGRRLR